MTVSDFLAKHSLLPGQIDAQNCVNQLLDHMDAGLRGQGNIPMLPSYLSAATTAPRNTSCCVLDAGGTNLRAARAVFDEAGHCTVENLRQMPMPGTLAPMEKDAFYAEIARLAQETCATEQIGFCFSYNVQLQRDLDGVLMAWCKEVQVPDAVGQNVGASLKHELGENCRRVHVLNDSVAAMLGAESPVTVGIILGTGINVCYEEQCSRIPKVEADLFGSSMIISTEVGEFDGIPKSDFDLAHFAATEDPSLAHAEKQCAGGYLGDLICRVWQGAAEEGVLPEKYREIQCSLPEISNLLDSRSIESDPALEIAESMIHRAAKIAAILCAGPVLRCTKSGSCVSIAVEGSQFHKLTGFRSHFEQALDAILSHRSITFRFVLSENACLRGAALAAFAQPM